MEKDRGKSFSTYKLKYHLTQHPQLHRNKLLAEKVQEEQREKTKTKSIQQKLFPVASQREVKETEESESSKSGGVKNFPVFGIIFTIIKSMEIV